MDKQCKINAFRTGLAQFVTFEEDEWEILSQHLSFSTLKKKEHFIVEGKVCDYMCFITRGAVRYYHIKDGQEITGYFSFENELMSAYKSFLKRTLNTNYIQAIEETDLVMISYQNLQQMLSHPLLALKMERFGRLVAEHYICCYEDRVTAFITQSPEERYTMLEKTAKDIFQRIPQHFIANFLGITPVSLSRIRKRTLLQ
ncbi:Crp/Fnr family transcriptional regulator [Pedobacter zeae]|uniref:cAMP-binding protein n=1 Tax=Pedobacter zeae TaxID=1737356 RepID=A0A7W6K9Y6_9SPHI|nr:Crp/Fnr family transcriptional regulator [Pedobacter zeae]MBB4107943.1 CRP-like cAMP-binding protein [Pedobacter zeae]GGG96033.1 cAMP-binding protein [Pedobacter zeae]